MAIGPVGMLDRDQVRHAVTAAHAARGRSGAQGWHIESTSQCLELHSDAGYACSAPGARAARVAFGAALMNLRLSVRSTGVIPDVRLLPDARRPDLIASVDCQVHDGAMLPDDRQLLEAVHHGDSTADRDPLGPVPEHVLAAMRVAARIEHMWFAEINTENRAAVTGLLSASRSQGASDEFSMVCIGSLTDEPVDQLNAGQAAQRVLLTGIAHGVDGVFVPELTTNAAVRLELRRLLGGGLWPQAALILHYRPPGTARRT